MHLLVGTSRIFFKCLSKSAVPFPPPPPLIKEGKFLSNNTLENWFDSSVIVMPQIDEEQMADVYLRLFQ